ncbi:Conserved_hypothetical protein [Hexamita inflata]|uniref:Transmembrane protein n=1 Tax=Hexamita inflata TaxID=28002 RepID=A0AA86N841_9EUKA|nr:Conserved hypothetical protein [Hexamita inflata]
MMLMFAALQYINQEVQYTYLDCYGDNSQISLSRDEFKFVIDLQIVNTNCAVFPNSISANLTVSNILIPDTLQLLVYNFNFLNTTRLEFKIPTHDSLGNIIDLNAYDEEFYAILDIFSYTEFTRVELTVFDDVRSDLENCFSSLQIQLDTDNFILDISPTKACIQQITLQSSPTDKTFISQTSIKLGTYSFDLDLTHFVNKYIANNNFSIQIFPNTDEMMDILADTNLKAILSLFSQQGLTNVQLNYRIYNFKSVQSVVFTQSQVFLYTIHSSQVHGFEVYFKYLTAADIHTTLQSLSYDEIQYRLTGRIGDTVYQVSSYFSPPFNDSLLRIDFPCDKGSLFEQAACAKQYYDDFTSEERPVYSLDILFLNQRHLVYRLKTSLEPIYDCWTITRSRINNNQLILELIFDAVACLDVQLSESGNLYLITENGFELVDVKTSGIDYNVMSWDCKQFTIDVCGAVQNGAELIYQFEYEGYINQFVVNMFKLENYQQSTISVVVVGSIFIICSVIITWAHIIFTQKIIKSKNSGKNKLKAEVK